MGKSYFLGNDNAGHTFVCSQQTTVSGFDIASPLTYHITTASGSTISGTTYSGIDGQRYQVDTPMIVLSFSSVSNQAGYVELYEDNGVAAEFNISGGSAVTLSPKNLASAAVCTATVKSGVTVTAASGTCLVYTIPMDASIAAGFNLQSNTEYLVRAVSLVDGAFGALAMVLDEKTIRSTVVS